MLYHLLSSGNVKQVVVEKNTFRKLSNDSPRNRTQTEIMSVEYNYNSLNNIMHFTVKNNMTDR